LFASELVREEAAKGDSTAAARRLEALQGIPLLDVTEEATELAGRLMELGVSPAKAADDAGHLATATVHGMEFLLTWNCRHLANAEIAEVIAFFLREGGYEPPVICTPEELVGANYV
jgi:predicted nucleic acid-binding protein